MAIRRSRYMKPNGPTSRLSGDCSVSGCGRPMFRGGLCSAHYKRKQRGAQVEGLIGQEVVDGGLELGEVLDPLERVIETGKHLVECSSEDDDLWKYRKRNFLTSAAQWLESLGWTPPANAGRKLARESSRV